jgi:hypothetical protein
MMNDPTQFLPLTSAVPNAPFCLHIGMPKTATTMLQRSIFSDHSQINGLGKFAAERSSHYPERSTRQLVRHISSGFRKPISDWAISELQANVQRAAELGQISVLSKEGLSTRATHNIQRLIDLIQRIFGECRILYTIREPLSFIESLYFQNLKGFQFGSQKPYSKYLGAPPRYFDINQWAQMRLSINKNFLNFYLSYADTAEMYANAFGKDRVKILIFEQLKSDQKQFIQELSDFLGIDADEALALSQNRYANVRWNESSIQQLKTVEASFRSRLIFRLRSLNGKKSMLGHCNTEANLKEPQPRAVFDPELQREILQIGCEQLTRLKMQWNLPLEKFGYPVIDETDDTQLRSTRKAA